MTAIPRILHQLWKDDDVPAPWRELQRGWQRHHPDWEYRLWTDEALRELVRAEAPAFLPVFDGYPHPICRADAGRYLVLRRHGGLYVDLDFECLRPIGPLLAGHELVVGEEPARHLEIPVVRERGVSRLLGNALLASAPGHPFWDFLMEQLRSHRDETHPIDATGPILLTRAVAAHPEAARLTIARADEVYPLDKFQVRSPSAAALAARVRDEGRAFALHHWAGSWLPPARQDRLQAQANGEAMP